MKTLADVLVLLVALLHVWFWILEMFLWKKPTGLKAFRQTPQKAEATAVLAANQGLYNLFLAGGLLVSFIFTEANLAFAFQFYFLGCMIAAGVYGAWSFNRTVLFVQALPATLALGVVMWTTPLRF